MELEINKSGVTTYQNPIYIHKTKKIIKFCFWFILIITNNASLILMTNQFKDNWNAPISAIYLKRDLSLLYNYYHWTLTVYHC